MLMLIRYALPFAFLFAASPAAAQANLSGVVINEILADPNSSDGPNYDTDGDGTAEADDEFVELYNGGDEAVDVSGWQIRDASTVLRHTFEAGTVLAPDGYVVVVGGWDPGTPPPGIFVANGSGGGSPGLGINNGGDELFLYDPGANAYIGAYFNGGQAPFPGPGDAVNRGEDDFGSDTAGESLQRVPSGTIVIVSLTPTPLAGVPVAAEEGPAAASGSFTAPSPNPAAGAAAITLTVARAQAVEVSVYDVTGRRVAVLLDRAMGAGETAALALDASALPSGVYVVRARGEGFVQAHRFTVVR